MPVTAVRRALSILSIALLSSAAAGAFVACGSDDNGGQPGPEDGGGGDATIDATAGDGGAGDGASGDGACAPKATCPADGGCGTIDDGCGRMMTCGMPCKNGNICDPKTNQCVPKSTACNDLGAQCGYVRDECGVLFDCGSCPKGEVCDGSTHKCVPTPPPSDAGCVPTTLSCTGEDGKPLCGTVSDGCGHTKSCTCMAPDVCGGGGVPGECGHDLCTGKCGPVPNACGSGTINCGNCPMGQVCNPDHTCGQCVPTNPDPCKGKTCGTASDGCKTVTCGAACPAPEVCNAGQCCTPKTCADLADAGNAARCGPLDDGCGGKVTCMTCTMPEVCNQGSCCTPLTCADLADAGASLLCSPVDNGCGGRITCQTCGASDRCVNGACKPCPDCDGGTCDNQAMCCYPKTCADVANPSCHSSDLGCGTSAVCAPCTTDQVCLSDGTCCTPHGCNGATGIIDNGCGQLIDCGPAPK